MGNMVAQSVNQMEVGVMKSTARHSRSGMGFFSKLLLKNISLSGNLCAMLMYGNLYCDKDFHRWYGERTKFVSVKKYFKIRLDT